MTSLRHQLDNLDKSLIYKNKKKQKKSECFGITYQVSIINNNFT